MDNLIRLIEQKIKDSEFENDNESELAFFKEFCNSFKLSDIQSLSNISNTAFLLALLRMNKNNLDFEQTDMLCSMLQEKLDGETFVINALDDYLDILEKFNQKGLVQELFNERDDSDKFVKNIDKPNKVFKAAGLAKEHTAFSKLDLVIFSVIEDDDISGYEIGKSRALLTLFMSLPDIEVFKQMSYLTSIVGALTHVEEQPLEDLKDLKKSTQVKLINEGIKSYIRNKNINILDYLSSISEYYYKLNNEYQKEKKKSQKKINKYSYLLEIIREQSKKKMILLDPYILNQIDDEIIKNEYLIVINKQNQNSYRAIEIKNNEYKDNAITKLEMLFTQHNFNFNKLTKVNQDLLINYGSLENIDNIFKSLKRNKIDFINEQNTYFIKILLMSSDVIIEKINNLLQKNILSIDFVLNNMGIFLSNKNKKVDDQVKPMYEILYKNIVLLADSGFNLIKIDENNFLMDNYDLMSMIGILSEYKLDFSDENSNNYSFLSNPSNVDLLDNYIELGLGKQAKKNSQYLSLGKEIVIKRILFAKQLDINILNASNKLNGQISTGNRFYVEDDKLDNFIIDYKEDYINPICLDILSHSKRNKINEITKNLQIIKTLDKNYLTNNFAYDFDGVLISRNRVLRNLDALLKNIDTSEIEMEDILYQAILYNMIPNVSKDKLENIYNIIKSLELESDKTFTKK